MKGNRRLLLAGAVAAALVLAAPATALGSVWKHEGSNLEELVEISLSGGEFFEIPPTGETKNGMLCNVHATMTTEGGSEAQITKFKTESCGNGFGSFAGCELSNAGEEAPGLPWTVEVNTSDLTILEWHTVRKFKAGCSTSELNKTIGGVTLTLDNPAAISVMEWHAEITGYMTRGSFALPEAIEGTYGIG